MKTFSRGFTKRMLSLLLSVMMILSIVAVGMVSTSAADVSLAETGDNIAGGTVIYLRPNSNWTQANAKFYAYFFNGSGNADVLMSDSDGDGVYEASAPSGTWTNVIFVRMDPNASAFSFDSNSGFWNKTSDLSVTGSQNLYTMANDAWTEGGGTWSTFVPAASGGENDATIYVDTANSSFSGSAPYIYVWETVNGTDTSIGSAWPGVQMTGPNGDGYYSYSFSYDTSYKFIINNGGNAQTADSDAYSESVLYVTFSSGVTSSVSTTDPHNKFWVDTNTANSSAIDLLYPDKAGNVYTLYLPAGANTSNLTFYVDAGVSLTIDGTAISSTGTAKSVSAGSTYTLGGDFSGTLKVMKSANVAAIYTTTQEAIPQGTGYGAHKDDYSTKGSIMMANADGTIRLNDSELSKIKGRGNSSWEASNTLIGKYAFNITLGSKSQLLDESAKSKKYCLVSYNADEARMRNMVIYELAQQIGLDYVADYEPVDLYNNGYYVGSYLLTDKVEIGDPLVDIVNLDDVNEELNPTIYDEETFVRAASNGNLNDSSTKGYYKYISNLTEPAASTYENSGFLLEFELNERFPDEISGFISTKGQQIVCKYPEFATRNEITFIMNKWNTAEALMYNSNATYEQLSTVIDVESFAKMYLIQELSKNLDGGATSYYVYYDGGLLHAGCAWDYDWTLGQYIQRWESYLSVDNQTSGKFDSEASNLLNNPQGWWINSKEIYPATGTLNAQAALCQNNEFWSVVVAEWNELFYDIALEFSDSTVSGVSQLDGTVGEFYQQIHASTEMDEDKWGIIAGDPLQSWASEDTGDDHNAATVYLNNWIYNRLTWMNGKLGSSSYVLPTPKLSADAAYYELGDTVTLIAESKSTGTLTYYFYDPSGTLIDTVTSSNGTATTSVTASNQGVSNYTVKVSSANTAAYSDAGVAEVNVETFDFSASLNAANATVEVGSNITLTATSNSTETVTYKLYTSGGSLVSQNTGGTFTIATTDSDINTTKSYYVVATTTIYGETYTATTNTVSVSVSSITDLYNVNIYFKSADSYGYKPNITTGGAISDLTDYAMVREAKIVGTNPSYTANYYWYKATVSVAKSSPSLSVRIVLASRYAMEGNITLTIDSSSNIYLAVDDLNAGMDLVDLSDLPEAERNWCQSAVHMIYDERYDSASFASVAANISLRYVGDSNNDGTVNVKDATHIQKFLASIFVLEGEDRSISDVDGDGRITIKDATAIQKRVAGL